MDSLTHISDGWLVLQGYLGFVSFIIQQVSLGLSTWWLMGFSKAVREGKCKCKCLRTFQSLHHVWYCPIGQSELQGQLKFQGWRKTLPLCGKSSKIILQWHEHKEGKNLWPFLPSDINVLGTSHLGSTDIVFILKYV